MLNRDNSSPYVRHDSEMKNQPLNSVFLLFSENLRQPLKGDAQNVSLGRIKTKLFNQGSRAHIQEVFNLYKIASRGGAPQNSSDRRRHRNNFQTLPAQAFPKKSKHLLRSELS